MVGCVNMFDDDRLRSGHVRYSVVSAEGTQDAAQLRTITRRTYD